MKEKIKQNLKKNVRWIIFTICILLFLSILEDLLQNQIYQFDANVYFYVEKLIHDPITFGLKIITNLGGALVLIGITIAILCWDRQKKYGKYIVLNLLLVAIVNQTLKFIIQRPRPEGFRLITETGYSFPSGHSMASTAFYGFLIYLIQKKVQNKRLKMGLTIVLSILIIAIGLSRIYLGVHYASDVCAGFLLSLAYLMIFTNIIKEKMQ